MKTFIEAIQILTRNKKAFACSVLEKLKLVKEEQGRCVTELKVEEAHQNVYGTLHGGLTATIIDQATSIVWIKANPVKVVSVDMNITYMGAAKVGSTIQIDAKMLKKGSKMAFLTCQIADKDTGKIIAHGRQTMFTG